MLATMLAFAAACGAGMVLSLRASVKRVPRRCPACRLLQLRWVGRGRHHTHYRCGACEAEFFEQRGKGLVTKQAWLAGAREPLPGARLLE